VPTLHEYLAYRLSEVVKPNLAPKNYEFYELLARLDIDPYLHGKRLDKLTASDVRRWLNVATMVRLPAGRVRKVRAWSVTEACQFLEPARVDHDPLDTGYVLMLVLGLRLAKFSDCHGQGSTSMPQRRM
jgi:Phage integrase, N-terminal SAM-like domain